MALPEYIVGDGSQYALETPGAWPVYARMMVFRKQGDAEPSHWHKEGHWTLISKGAIQSGDKVHKAPSMFWTHAGVMHDLVAVEDDTHCVCIHDKRALMQERALEGKKPLQATLNYQPREWQSLEHFAAWYLEEQMPLAVPAEAEVFRTDDATALCVFRSAPYQVEIYLIDDAYKVPLHSHPQVENIQMLLLNPGDPQPIPGYGVDRMWGVFSNKQVNGQPPHGGLKGSKSRGWAMLVFEKWPEDREMSTIAANWKGTPVGPKHQALIKRFFPEML